MLTWLDYYVAGSIETLRKSGVAAARVAGMDDRAAMVMLCRSSLLQLARAGGVDAPDLGVGPLLAACILPFCATAPGERGAWVGGWEEPHGLQPEAALVADLADARPPADGLAEAVAELRRRTWYIDLPHRALLLDGRRQVRAIFAMAGPAADAEAGGAIDPARWSGVMVVAVVTRAGDDRIEARAAWSIGADGGASAVTPLVEAAPPFDDAEARRRVTDFLLLLTLYRLTAMPDEREELPRRPAGRAPATKPHKLRAERRRWTLFRVVRLRPPADRFGRPDAARGESGSWRLDHRVRVRGHFRLQAHGPGHSLRRLQWIAAHERGPHEAPARTDLDRLRS